MDSKTTKPAAPAPAGEGATRREFNTRMLGSLIAYGMVETLWSRGLFAAGESAVVGKWFAELAALSGDLNGHKLKDTEFQAKMEELYRRVDLPALIKAIKLDDLAKETQLPDRGAASIGFDLTKVEGVPSNLGFGKQIFGLKKGRSIVPHGHANMCTGFIVLRGTFRGRHWDRVETHPDHYLIKPTIDRQFKPGELSTISDHKDNVHWFESLSDTGFVFNVHVIGYDPTLHEGSGRLYMDADGEKVSDGLVLAKKMTSDECHKKYG